MASTTVATHAKNATIAGLFATIVTTMGAGYSTYLDHKNKEIQIIAEAQERMAGLKIDYFDKICAPVLKDEKGDQYPSCKRAETQILQYDLNLGRIGHE